MSNATLCPECKGKKVVQLLFSSGPCKLCEEREAAGTPCPEFEGEITGFNSISTVVSSIGTIATNATSVSTTAIRPANPHLVAEKLAMLTKHDTTKIPFFWVGPGDIAAHLTDKEAKSIGWSDGGIQLDLFFHASGNLKRTIFYPRDYQQTRYTEERIF